MLRKPLIFFCLNVAFLCLLFFPPDTNAVDYSFDSINHWSNANVYIKEGMLYLSGTAGSMHETPYGVFTYNPSSEKWTRISSDYNQAAPRTTKYKLMFNSKNRKLILHTASGNKKISEHAIALSYWDETLSHAYHFSPTIDYEDDNVIWYTLSNYYADGNTPVANGVIYLPTMKWYEVKTGASSFSDIYKDGDTYWAGTARYSDFGGAGDGSGLYKFDLKSKKIIPVEEINRLLPNKGILSLVKFKSDLWVVTVFGLVKLNLEKQENKCFGIRKATIKESIKKDEVTVYLPNLYRSIVPFGNIKITEPYLSILGTNAAWEKKYFYLVELPERLLFWTAKNKKANQENKGHYSTDYTQYGYPLYQSSELKGSSYFVSHDTVGVHNLVIKEEINDRVKLKIPFAYIKAENIVPILETISCEALTSRDRKE